MTAYLLTNHLLNFVAPAAFLALVVVVLSRLVPGFKPRRPPKFSAMAQIAIVFAVGLAALAGGLLFFRNDGKLLAYAALVVGAATCQWILLGGWRAKG